MKRLSILVFALACASARRGAPASDGYDAEPSAPPTIVQVREFPHSSLVEVVAWSPEESAYGFRALLRRDGTLVQDHRLYVSTYFGGGISVGRSNNAYATYPYLVQTVDSAPRMLLAAGVARDDYACFYDLSHCSPFVMFAVRVPDDVLRAKRDSIGVLLYRRGGNEVAVTVYRDVIDPYLKAVDSVSASLRRTY
jgi:hypothetical protein